MKFFAALSAFLLISAAHALDNGLALTPPMGWLTWERYRCVIDCEAFPDECISEKLIMKMADLMVSEGYAEVGYDYLGIDDCWMERERDSNGKLVPDKKRFPRGMKFIGDYIHSKGLKFGIYQDFGTHTCEGYPGILGHSETDANSFAEWGADYVKLDGCNVDVELMDEGYPEFGMNLNKTDRPMLYSCSWPFYKDLAGIPNDFDLIIKNCNLWRNYYDIQDSWGSVESIIKYFGDKSSILAKYAGPGHWNDPDMLVIGNFGLSFDQSQVQMAVWSILAAPLLMSNDLANIRKEYKEILQNKAVLAVNQDILGRAGMKILDKQRIEVWKREVMPILNGEASLAFAFVNYNSEGMPRIAKFEYNEIGLSEGVDYDVTDLFSSETFTLRVEENKAGVVINVKVNPTGVRMLKFVVHQ